MTSTSYTSYTQYHNKHQTNNNTDHQSYKSPSTSTSSYIPSSSSSYNLKHSLLYSLIYILLLSICTCTQIQILPNPNHNQLKSINLLKSLRKFRQRYINIYNDTYVCVTAIKQKSLALSTSSSSSSSSASSASASSSAAALKSKQISTYLNGNIPTISKIQPSIFSQKLNLLIDNIGIRHYTKQFIYGYKHKRIISQFDDQYTKYNNQKKQLQNFTMGLYDLRFLTQQQLINNNQQNSKKRIEVNTDIHTYDNDHQFDTSSSSASTTARINNNNNNKDKDNKPHNILHNFYIPLNQLKSQQAANMINIDHKNLLLNLGMPLQSSKHTYSKTYNITFNCTNTTYIKQLKQLSSLNPNNIYQVEIDKKYYIKKQIGFSLTNYQILLLNYIPLECQEVVEIVKSDNWLLAFNSNINILDDKIFGDLDRFCDGSVGGYTAGSTGTGQNTRRSNGKSVNIGNYLFIQVQRGVQIDKQDRKKLDQLLNNKNKNKQQKTTDTKDKTNTNTNKKNDKKFKIAGMDDDQYLQKLYQSDKIQIKIQTDPITGQPIISILTSDKQPITTSTTGTSSGVPPISTPPINPTTHHTSPDGKITVIKQYYLIQIKQIIGQHLYVIGTKMPWLLKPKKCTIIDHVQGRQIKYNGQIQVDSYGSGSSDSTSGNDRIRQENRILQKYKTYNHNKNQIIKLEHVGNRIVKVHQNFKIDNNKINKQQTNTDPHHNHHTQHTQHNNNNKIPLIKTGSQLLCFTQVTFISAPNNPIATDMGITIGKQFGNGYYEVHPWMSMKALEMYLSLGEFNSQFYCVEYHREELGEGQEQKEGKQNINTNNQKQYQPKYYNPYSQVIKMTKYINNKIYVTNKKQLKKDTQNIQQSQKQQSQEQEQVQMQQMIQQYDDDSIFVFTLSPDAVVEVRTVVGNQDQDGRQKQNIKKDSSSSSNQADQQISPAEDLITQDYKIQVQDKDKNKESQSNPKKSSSSSPSSSPSSSQSQSKSQPLAHNKYYLTSHKIYKVQTAYKNNTKIRAQRYQNSFYQNNTNDNMIIIHKGIWRFGDFIKFPRFLFEKNQKITQIHIKYGIIFIRIFNLKQNNKNDFAISSQDLTDINFGYGPKVRPQKTISTEYRFKWGTFCGGSINKNRQTLIKIKCGQPWYKLQSVTQISPCSYQIQIISQYLCDKNIIFPALKHGFNTFTGSICVPGGIYNTI